MAAPISSFSLNTRPMVFHGDDAIEVQVIAAHEGAGITLDGQVSALLSDDDVVRIKRAPFTSQFVVFPENSFYKVLRSKLHWGIHPLAKN